MPPALPASTPCASPGGLLDMENIADSANRESSVVANLLDRTSLVKAEPGDKWSSKEIVRVYNLLSDKKRGELKLMKKRREDINGEVPAVTDDDDEKFFAFRSRWMAEWSGGPYGSWDNVTRIHSMPFTYHHGRFARPCDTLQIYLVKVTGLSGGLDFPLDVFGMVAVRDSIDRRLNLVFYRSRENCQTLTEEDRYLALTGPTRAVVLDHTTAVFVEVELKVRGKVESEDRYLSFFAETVPAPFPGSPRFGGLNSTCYKSKCSSLTFTFASITDSVEATIFIRVIEGSWPVGVHGEIIALSCAEHEKLLLLKFGADNIPVSCDGDVELSRQVVSVNTGTELIVSHNVREGGILAEKAAVFEVKSDGRSRATLQCGTCVLEILVAWSLVSPTADLYEQEYC